MIKVKVSFYTSSYDPYRNSHPAYKKYIHKMARLEKKFRKLEDRKAELTADLAKKTWL